MLLQRPKVLAGAGEGNQNVIRSDTQVGCPTQTSFALGDAQEPTSPLAPGLRRTGLQAAIEIRCGTDEGKVRECLGKVAEQFAGRAELF